MYPPKNEVSALLFLVAESDEDIDPTTCSLPLVSTTPPHKKAKHVVKSPGEILCLPGGSEYVQVATNPWKPQVQRYHTLQQTPPAPYTDLINNDFVINSAFGQYKTQPLSTPHVPNFTTSGTGSMIRHSMDLLQPPATYSPPTGSSTYESDEVCDLRSRVITLEHTVRRLNHTLIEFMSKQTQSTPDEPEV